MEFNFFILMLFFWYPEFKRDPSLKMTFIYVKPFPFYEQLKNKIPGTRAGHIDKKYTDSIK
jgi:hypothetical protein